MSVLPESDSATIMAQAIRNGNEERGTFNKFFESWLLEQNQNLRDLVSASIHYQDNHHPHNHQNGHLGTNPNSPNPENEDAVLRPVIGRVIRHYEQYYRAKSRCAKQDVLAMFSPPWLSTLEDAFLWIGGWRPSMAFHLLYSKSGLQLEARLSELIQGISTGDLGDLSPSQLVRVDELQGRTIKEEKEITEKMAKHQETVADSSMVELSHAASELTRNGPDENGTEAVDRVESTLSQKEEGLEAILHSADDLRLRTLKEVVDILTPIQAVHFLIAAAELHLRLHDWGKKKDIGTDSHVNGN